MSLRIDRVLRKETTSRNSLHVNRDMQTSNGATQFSSPLPIKKTLKSKKSVSLLVNKENEEPDSTNSGEFTRRTRSNSRKLKLSNETKTPIIDSKLVDDSMSPITSTSTCTFDSTDSDIEIRPRKAVKKKSFEGEHIQDIPKEYRPMTSNNFYISSPKEEDPKAVLSPDTRGNTSDHSFNLEGDITHNIFDISAPKTSRLTCLLDRTWQYEDGRGSNYVNRTGTSKRPDAFLLTVENVKPKNSITAVASPLKKIRLTESTTLIRNSTSRKSVSKSNKNANSPMISKKSINSVMNKSRKSKANQPETTKVTQLKRNSQNDQKNVAQTGNEDEKNLTFINKTVNNTFSVTSSRGVGIENGILTKNNTTVSSSKDASQLENNDFNVTFNKNKNSPNKTLEKTYVDLSKPEVDDVLMKHADSILNTSLRLPDMTTNNPKSSVKKKDSVKKAEKGQTKSVTRKSDKKKLKRTKSEAYCELLAKLLNSSDNSDDSFSFPQLSSSEDNSPNQARNTFSISPSNTFLNKKRSTITRSEQENPKTPVQEKLVSCPKSSTRKSQRKLWNKPSEKNPIQLAKQKEIFESELLSPKPKTGSLLSPKPKTATKKKEKLKKRVTLFDNVIDLSSPHSSTGSKDSDVIFVGVIPDETNSKVSKKFVKTPYKRTSTFTKDTDTSKSDADNAKSKKKPRSRSASCVDLLETAGENNFEDSSDVSRVNSFRLRRSSSFVLNRDVSEFMDMSGVPSSTVVESKTKYNISSSFTSISSLASKKMATLGTPQRKKKTNLVMKALANQQSTQKPEANTSTHNPQTKPSSRIKMPNFSKIHQKNNEKLENITDMLKRKAARAEFLLSGTKPNALLSPSASSSRRQHIKKQLEFPYTNRDLIEKVRQLSPLVNSPRNLSKSMLSVSTKLNQKVAFGDGQLLKPMEKNKKASPAKTKSKLLLPHKVNKGLLSPIKNSKLATPLRNKKAISPLKNVSKPLTPFKMNKNTVKDGYSRFGFKFGGAEKATKEEQIKAVATKTKVPKNTTENKRKELKGVRVNRRFELLMKMRNAK